MKEGDMKHYFNTYNTYKYLHMVCTHLYIYNIYIQNIRIFFENTYTIRTNTYVPLKIRMCLAEILYVFPVRIRTYLYVFVRIFVRIAYVLRTYSYVSYVFVRIRT